MRVTRSQVVTVVAQQERGNAMASHASAQQAVSPASALPACPPTCTRRHPKVCVDSVWPLFTIVCARGVAGEGGPLNPAETQAGKHSITTPN